GGAFKAPGSPLTITWNEQSAPPNSGVSVYLVPSDGNSKLLLVAQQSPSGSYTWQSQGPECASPDCDLLIGAPGTYTILVEAYSPSNACYGGGVCPDKSKIHPTILATASSNSFVITDSGMSSVSGGNASGGTSGTTFGAYTSSSSTGMTINITYDASVANAPAGFTSAVQDVANFFTSHY